MQNQIMFRLRKLSPSLTSLISLIAIMGTVLSVNVAPAVASSTVLYVLNGGTLSQTAGAGATTNTIPSAGGTNHDGTPTNPIIYTLSAVNGTYDSALSTAFNLYVDAGTAVGNGQQAQVQYDFTGDGTWDRTETYNYFATDPVVGNELYTQAKGLKSSSGTFSNLSNGKVRIQVWSAIGNAASTLRVSATTAQGQVSTLTIPFALGGGGPTNTPTNTSVGPTNTPTNTAVGPTNTPTRTNTPAPTATPGSCGSGNMSLNRTATSSSNENASLTPNLAVDGSTTTRWSSAFSDPQWIRVDLGSTQSVCRVKLNWEAAYGKSYQIQTSPDGTTWTNIYSTTTGDGGIDDLTGLSGSGRYVRMNGTVRATPYGYSLWEFEIYGSGGPGPTSTPVPTSPPFSGTLVWSDEFNGTSLDTINWTLETGGGGFGNSELEYYTNGQNLSFTGAEMIITARKENPNNYQCWYGTCTYTSSRLKTQGKREFKWGRMEARLQIPYSQGLWPAFWMLGNDIGTVGWPTSGEIDIMENIGREPAIVHGTIHGPGYSGCCGIGGSYTLPSGALHDAYHVFAVEWDTNNFKWFIDSTQYFSTTRTFVQTKGNWVYDHPFFFLLNVAVGGAWPGNPDGTSVFPQTMKVDYVRVYQ